MDARLNSKTASKVAKPSPHRTKVIPAAEITEIERKIGISFRNKELLERALIHRSYLNENREAHESYERLEFLGDKVLALVVGQHLFRQFPEHEEGDLTHFCCQLLSNETATEVIKVLALDRHLRASRGQWNDLTK